MMRSTTLSLLIALAVFFTAMGASAQGAGHCVNLPVASIESNPQSRALPRKARDQRKEPVLAASRVTRVTAAQELPGRSQMPTMCVDANQPGCQIERSDSPHHNSFSLADIDAGEATDLFAGIDTPPEAAPCAGGWYEGSAREGFSSAFWRPPAR
jgi:hypothetical protein